MFVETKEFGEVSEAPEKIATLSEAMRIGGRYFTQSFLFFGPEKHEACALGAAAVVAGYETGMGESPDDFLARIYGVPSDIIIQIHGRNACRSIGPEYTFHGIADWLEARGL